MPKIGQLEKSCSTILVHDMMLSVLSYREPIFFFIKKNLKLNCRIRNGRVVEDIFFELLKVLRD